MDRLKNYSQRQTEIIAALGVKPNINPLLEIERRVNFLTHYLLTSGANGYVLGISGGQDSFVAGALAQLTINRLREYSGEQHYQFVAMKLPYGTQRDEGDVIKALHVIKPDQVIAHNIKPEVDVMAETYEGEMGIPLSDYLKGNDKARARMLAQYRVAGALGLLVIGTDHAAEAVTGFFTKYGDGGCDVTPLSGLTKRQGREMAKILRCPKSILDKRPSADLLDAKPQQADEDELGLSYDLIDDFLEGKNIAWNAEKIIQRYDTTAHKRDAIPHP